MLNVPNINGYRLPNRDGLPLAAGQEHALDLADYDEDFARLISKWSASFSDILIDVRELFGGDLDKFVIYLVFAVGEFSRRADDGAVKGINALSIADITRIPRETTRRKLRELAAFGHLRCGEDGLWYLGASPSMDVVSSVCGTLLDAGGRMRLVTLEGDRDRGDPKSHKSLGSSPSSHR